MPVDHHIKRMMQDLGHALAQAIATSPKVGSAVRRIRREGYSLYLALDRKDDGERGVRIELTTRHSSKREPVFVLDQSDVSFLKSMGIDATRKGKRRRS